MPIHRVTHFLLVPLALLACQTAQAASVTVPAIDVQVDIDSRIDRGGLPRPILTQPGHLSWDLTEVTAAGGPALTHQGVTFEVFGPSGPSSFGSRNRGSTGGLGGSNENLLADMVFADYFDGCFVGLRISGLPVGRYRMESWHFDSHPYALADNNHLQIEVASVGEVAQVVVDYFPLGVAPANFEFEVTVPGETKDIVFREDDIVPQPVITFPNQRARLNGFRLVSVVPEPASIWLACCVWAAGRSLRRISPLYSAAMPG